MISNELDFEPYRLALARQGRVQIPDFLQAPAAERLAECLERDVPWRTAERGHPDRPAMPGTAEDVQALSSAQLLGQQGFHFIYDRYLMVEAMREGRDPQLLLHTVLEFLNSPPFLQFIREFTGDRQLAMVGAQATRYRPGQFLRLHDDRHDEEARRYAYVINLSRRWEADWGGLLHLVNDAGAVVDTFLPRWNSLSLFKVPALHYVGLVAPWAKVPRQAITGWWHAKPA